MHFGFRTEIGMIPFPGSAGTTMAILLAVLLLLTFAISTLPLAQAGEIYRYTAPDGSVLYTNMPLEPVQAERIFHDPPPPSSGLGFSAPPRECRIFTERRSAGRPGCKVRSILPHDRSFPPGEAEGTLVRRRSAEMVLKYYGFPGRQDDIAFGIYDNRSTGTTLETSPLHQSDLGAQGMAPGSDEL